MLIPSLGIDTEVQISEVVEVTGGGTLPSCLEAPSTGSSPQAGPTLIASLIAEASPSPSSATLGTTFTVPSEGVATPRDAFDHLQYRSWIFGHSRWHGVPGLFFGLLGIELGEELFVDGVDRLTGDPIDDVRFVVTGIYLADRSVGGPLVSGDRIGPPGTPLVILQTSVREIGVNRPWILDRETLMEKAENVVEGDLDDPCKYLLLFVVAEQAP